MMIPTPNVVTLIAIEKELDQSILQLAQALASQRMHIVDMSIIMAFCLKIDPKMAVAMIDRDGIQKTIKALSNMFTRVISADSNALHKER